MYRIGTAVAATFIAVGLLSGSAYEASSFTTYLLRAVTHVGPAITMIISTFISLGGAYFAIWIGLRQRLGKQIASRNSSA
jgi:hypothetical protein